jgi:hypothetical protein
MDARLEVTQREGVFESYVCVCVSVMLDRSLVQHSPAFFLSSRTIQVLPRGTPTPRPSSTGLPPLDPCSCNGASGKRASLAGVGAGAGGGQPAAESGLQTSAAVAAALAATVAEELRGTQVSRIASVPLPCPSRLLLPPYPSSLSLTHTYTHTHSHISSRACPLNSSFSSLPPCRAQLQVIRCVAACALPRGTLLSPALLLPASSVDQAVAEMGLEALAWRLMLRSQYGTTAASTIDAHATADAEAEPVPTSAQSQQQVRERDELRDLFHPAHALSLLPSSRHLHPSLFTSSPSSLASTR